MTLACETKWSVPVGWTGVWPAGFWCEGVPRAGGACWQDSYQTDRIVCLNTWGCWCDPRRGVERESQLLDVRTLVLREKPRCVTCMVTLRCDQPGQRGEPGSVSRLVKTRGVVVDTEPPGYRSSQSPLPCKPSRTFYGRRK